MAWRIDDAVVHGEIDNTVEGRTTGRIWLIGRDEPLILSLDGDCWRDLAGTRLTFENPEPEASPDAEALDMDQCGIIGDMTASRKARVTLVDEADEPIANLDDLPFEWHNILYLEWFSEINGRVVIETADYQLGISPHEWQMDEDAEEAQKLANLNAMRDFMAQVIRRREPGERNGDAGEELDEFAWEERLKESDRLTEAYQEVLEKYMEDADSEQKEAFVMGWDGLLDAIAEREESTQRNFPGSRRADDAYSDGFDFETDDAEEPDDSGDFGLSADGSDDEDDGHPLQVKAQELAMRTMDIIQRDAGPGSPSYELVSNLLQVSGKLAGVLHGRTTGYEPETGFVLAVLKRCLNWINEAAGACQQLVALEKDADQRAALEHVRLSMFEIRAEIVELRRELK